MRLGILATLLVLVPMVSSANPPAVLSSYDMIAPDGVAHVEELEVDGHRQIHCAITSNDGDAELTYDGRSIRFGDGYAIEITTLAKTPSSFVVRLVATAPHGPSSTAIVARSLRTGETTSAGLEEFSVAMRRSRHAQIAARVLQDASAEGRKLQVGSLSRPPFTVRPMDCATDGMGVIASAVGMLSNCSNPANAIQCVVSMGGFIGATYSLWRDCPDIYLDNSIGF